MNYVRYFTITDLDIMEYLVEKKLKKGRAIFYYCRINLPFFNSPETCMNSVIE